VIDKFHDKAMEALLCMQEAVQHLAAGVPHAVCPKCGGEDSKGNGKACRSCRGAGHVPMWRYLELEGK
jgi:hypothetical protein